jgi:hypothetical protein
MDPMFSPAHLYMLVCDVCTFGVILLVLWSCISAFRYPPPPSQRISNAMAEPIEDPPVRVPRPPELGIQLAESIHSYRMEHDDAR